MEIRQEGAGGQASFCVLLTQSMLHRCMLPVGAGRAWLLVHWSTQPWRSALAFQQALFVSFNVEHAASMHADSRSRQSLVAGVREHATMAICCSWSTQNLVAGAWEHAIMAICVQLEHTESGCWCMGARNHGNLLCSWSRQKVWLLVHWSTQPESSCWCTGARNQGNLLCIPASSAGQPRMSICLHEPHSSLHCTHTACAPASPSTHFII